MENSRGDFRSLCELGRWLLEDSDADYLLDPVSRREAFDACASPTEWQEFLRHRDPAEILVGVYDAIQSRCSAK